MEQRLLQHQDPILPKRRRECKTKLLDPHDQGPDQERPEVDGAVLTTRMNHDHG